MELTKEEEAALKWEKGEALELAYWILVATVEATNAERLIPIEWSHLYRKEPLLSNFGIQWKI